MLEELVFIDQVRSWLALDLNIQCTVLICQPDLDRIFVRVYSYQGAKSVAKSCIIAIVLNFFNKTVHIGEDP